MIPTEQYRWYIVLATLLNQALSVGIIVYSFALFVVPWLDAFGIGRGYAMTAIFIFQVSVGLLSPLFGRMMDIYPMRWLVLTGGGLIAAGLILASLATAFWQIILVYATFLPIGMILCGTLASQTMVSKWFTDKRGMAIGLSSMGTSLGGLIIPVVTSLLIVSLSWQTALWLLAIVTLLLMLPLNYLILRRNAPKANTGIESGGHIDARTWTTREILTTRKFWIPVLGLVPINAAFGGVQFNLGAYVSDLGGSQEFAASLIAITSLSMIVGKFAFGSLGDRMDHRQLYWVMAGLLLAALYFYSGSPEDPELMLAAVFQGFATGGVMPMMGIMYASRFGTLSFGRVLGLVNLFLMIGSFGSIFSGWIFDVTRSYDVAFLVFAAALAPSIILIAYLPKVEIRNSI